jgi:hypothetical protein
VKRFALHRAEDALRNPPVFGEMKMAAKKKGAKKGAKKSAKKKAKKK